MIRCGVELALFFTLSAGLAPARAQQADSSPPDRASSATACGECLGGPAVGLRATSALAPGDTGLGALFAINTVTGVWNLIESRHEPAGRFRRWLHSLSMLAADAGFMLTANAAGEARRTDDGANRHRNLAIGSMGLAAASTIIMWLWKD